MCNVAARNLKSQVATVTVVRFQRAEKTTRKQFSVILESMSDRTCLGTPYGTPEKKQEALHLRTPQGVEAYLKKGGVEVLEFLLRRSEGSMDTLESHPQLPLGVAQRLVQASDGVQFALELVYGCRVFEFKRKKHETWHELGVTTRTTKNDGSRLVGLRDKLQQPRANLFSLLCHGHLTPSSVGFSGMIQLWGGSALLL